MEQMSIQIGLLQRAVSNVPVVAPDAGARLRIPEPKAYSGARDAKEVENFFSTWSSISLLRTSRTRRGKCRLRQSGIAEVGAYRLRAGLCETFSALMLDIRDMSEKDKLFTFMEGLKPWARLELQRQRVIDLGSAMAAAERLTDFNPENRKDRQTTPSPSQNKPGGARSFRSNSNRGGGDRKPHAQSSSQGSFSRNKPQENKQGRRRREQWMLLMRRPASISGLPEETVVECAGDLH
ncbi:UNVERIFIED_CONTAM: hypothetical protein Sangu_2656100 [Sesamum angustifolium]|uniref:Gag protein n=1 Tax=Sesamum angustifolium TaxID=2727405 RepID=A0AAW2J4M7_9LAMI